MQMALSALVLIGLIPLGLAFWTNRRTSLAHALVWALVAWLSWGVAFWFAEAEKDGMEPARYCALCLTGCAGVAVLGARRPHVFAWNFVVIGLFAVMVLPLIETRIIGTHPVDGLRIFFMAGTILVGIVNYLPTRLAPAALVLMLVSAGEIARLYVPAWLPGLGEAKLFDWTLTGIPWLGWICLARSEARQSPFDRLWLSFRNRWGLVWSQRVREQFNNAAQNAGWSVQLTWGGLTEENGASSDQEKLVAMLQATLQRFVAADRR